MESKLLTTTARITKILNFVVYVLLFWDVVMIVFLRSYINIDIVFAGWLVLWMLWLLREAYFLKFESFFGLRVDWEKKWIYIFDIDGTVTSSTGVVLEDVRLRLIELLKLDSVIVFNTGNTMENALKNIGYLKNYLTHANQVYVAVEYGLNIIDLFTGQEINNNNFENILTNPMIRDSVCVSFVKFSDLLPYNGEELRDGDRIVCDGKRNKYILTKEVSARAKYPIGYVSIQKSKMITVELFKDESGRVLEWCLQDQNAALADCKKLIKQNNLSDKLAVTKSGTAMDFLPRVNGVAYDKSYSTGFLLELVAREKAVDLKKLLDGCVAFGDGFADFAMQTPRFSNRRNIVIDMVYVGGRQNFKHDWKWWKVSMSSGEVLNENSIPGCEKNGEFLRLALFEANLFRKYHAK